MNTFVLVSLYNHFYTRSRKYFPTVVKTLLGVLSVTNLKSITSVFYSGSIPK